MKSTNVKVSSIVEYQLPEFVRVEYPLLVEFLKEYYRYTESNFEGSDIISNISNYIKIDSLSNIADTFYLYNKFYTITSILKDSTTILNDENVVKITTKENHNLIDDDLVDIVLNSETQNLASDLIDSDLQFVGKRFYVSIINETQFYLKDSTQGVSEKNISNSTDGVGTCVKTIIDTNEKELIIYSNKNNKKSLSLKYGLIKIDDEIILYKDIDPSPISLPIESEFGAIYGIKLLDCARGFSGKSSLGNDTKDELIFEETKSQRHFSGSEVTNLNSIFFKKFLQKIKYQFLPGFENRELNPDLNESIFIKQSKDFYSSKGTDISFKILFNALYGKNVKVIKPRDYLIEPSDAKYQVLKNLVVEALEGNPEDLLNRTLYQDDVGFIKNARGTVSFVERIERNKKEYYIISIDDGYERDINFRGTLFSQFSVHPKTLCIGNIEIGSTTIDVDSTIGFPPSGNLLIKTYDESTNTEFKYNISYKSKSVNQFFECQTIGSIIPSIRNIIYTGSEVFTDAFAYGFMGTDSNELIKVRISGVLSEFEQNEKTFLYKSGNRIRVKSLGKNSKNLRDNNWVFNVPVTYDIDKVEVLEVITNTNQPIVYKIFFKEEHNFYKSDKFIIDQTSESSQPILGFVRSVVNKNCIVLRLTESIPANTLQNYSITKILSKTLLDDYPDLSIYNSNVQNVYIDEEDNTIVASNSLPAYSDNSGGPIPLDIKDGSVAGTFFFGKETIDTITTKDKTFSDGTIDYAYVVIFNITGSGSRQAVPHTFYTGDEVVFRSLESNKSPIEDGIYYIREYRSEGDNFGFKLTKSRSNLLNERYVSPVIIPPKTVPDVVEAKCSLQYYEFSIVDYKNNSSDNLTPKKIEPQKLFKKISTPVDGKGKVETSYGPIGIFANGVELLNYKSKNIVFYGPIEKINVTSFGNGYDIINPPDITVEDIGGTSIKYDSKFAPPLQYRLNNQLQPVKFGANPNTVGFTTITVGGPEIPNIGDEERIEIKISNKSLLLGKEKLYINQSNGGSILRINGQVASIGGDGGTPLSVGGEGGFEVKVSDDRLTLGNIGSGCLLYPFVDGSLERLDILYPGFNYIGTPEIEIYGGGGSGALAKPIMESFEYKIPFNTSQKANQININTDTIGFSTFHNFENYEEVIYISGISTNVSGLQDNGRYFISVVDGKRLRLHKSKKDATLGISTINLSSYSTGIHYLKSVKNKSKIGTISIINSGSGYKNKKVSTSSSNINTVTNTIEVLNHGYNSGDILIYFTDGSPIGGLNQNVSYYVTVIDKNTFKLSDLYVDQDKFEASEDFYFQTGQYVNLTSSGSGNHYFNYEPISVKIKGFIGVSTSSGQDLNAKVLPIFRGQIKDLFVANKGSNYGTSDILNYVRQPVITTQKGKNAQLTPLISQVDGSITEILIINEGSNYFSTPDIIIRGNGVGAVATPVIVNGKIKKIILLYSGFGYDKKNTIVEVVNRGEGLKTSVYIKPWRVNLLSRYRLTNRETEDGGFVYSNVQKKGLQYSHIYLPDKLRDILYSIDSSKNASSDFLSDREQKKHSPIVGWAYDGNPIYGPYGYKNGQSGLIDALKSGYSIFSEEERIDGPSVNLYPPGFFVEDYQYKDSNNGDLDESNGRYCKTPEYPNGTYAYFCTVDTSQILDAGSGYPSQFPYVIGNFYKSLPIDFNFEKKTTQDDIDINLTKWIRNIFPYRTVNTKNSRYKYLFLPNKVKDPISKVKYASYGEIQSVDVIVKGNDYKIKDKIEFVNSTEIGQNATAEVSLLDGVEVNTISIARSSFEQVVFEKDLSVGKYIGFVNIPHGYLNNDVVSITTPIERVVFKEINFFKNILSITKDIPPVNVSGIITYFNVSGDLSYPIIRENDIYSIQDPLDSNNYEEIKILNVDNLNSLIRVHREYNNYSSSTTINSGSIAIESPRKFFVNLGIQTYYNFNKDFEYYFSTKESIGVGRSYGPGITSTNYFKYPRVGFSSITIPTRSIYLPNHGFETNDEIEYDNSIENLNQSLIIISFNGNNFNQELSTQSTLYAVKLSNDLIGLSTSKVGYGTTGSLVSLTTNSDPLLYFASVNDSYASLKTKRKNKLVARVSQNIVKVSTASTHGLKNDDFVDITVNPRNNVNVKIEYNDLARILVTDPLEFISADVNISESSINIENHNYSTGDKLLYKSQNPMSGLSDNQIYYVVAINRNIFSLCNSLYETTKEFPRLIKFTNATSGKVYKVNPEIRICKNQTIIFDLSSETLSYAENLIRFPAFTFDLYSDSNFNSKYLFSGKQSSFEVQKSGVIGVDNDAKVTVYVSDNFPLSCYYKLTPVINQNNDESKLKLFLDTEQRSNNKLTVVESKYNGKYKIFDVQDFETPSDLPHFKYQIAKDPENDSYDTTNIPSNLILADVSYVTDSKNTQGPINKAVVKNAGRYFYSLPDFTKINSLIGDGAILNGNSTNIGEIKTVEINDIGFDYSSDFSIRPIAKLPTIFKVEPLYSIKSITIVSNGVNYLTPPKIKVIDSKTLKVIDDLELKYNLGDNFVTIVKNTKNLSNVVPKLIPTENSNAIPILTNIDTPIILNENNNSDIDEVLNASNNSLLDPTTADKNDYVLPDSLTFTNRPTIQVFLEKEYSSIFDFPFQLGDLVYIEDVVTISDGQGIPGKGFNSENNGFAFYKVIRRDPNVGGAEGSITLDFEGYLDTNIQDPEDSDFYKVDNILSEAARVVPVKYFPKYVTTLEKNNFVFDELVVGEDESSEIGIVEEWDKENDYIKISEILEFNAGQTIIGQTSKTKAILIKKIEFNAGYRIDNSSNVTKGWAENTGKLNFDLQRLHDSDYYQYFSYSLKSQIPLDKWNDAVSSLNHTAGFKKFSELEVESLPNNYSGINTSQNFGVTSPISSSVSEVSVNCVYDFDLAREITFGTDPVRSNEIIFGSRILQDYIESVNNRVLSIDDISKNFNALPRETSYSIIARSDTTKIRSRKLFTYMQDRRYVNEKQMMLLTTVHNNRSGFGSDVYIGQYGRLETVYDIAYFESEIIGEQQNLLFYPSKDLVNNYLIDFVAFEMTDDPLDVEELFEFGNVAGLYNQVGLLQQGSLAGIAQTVVGIASTFRSSKLLIQVGSATTNYYELNELLVSHNDLGDVKVLDYGELTTGYLNNSSAVGIASYWAKMSPDGQTLDIIMTPREDLTDDYNIKTVTISIANTSFSNTDNLGFDTGEIRAFSVSGIGTTNPIQYVVTSYPTQYKCQYSIATIVGMKTDSVIPYNLGPENHGISDWYAFENGSAVYSAIYPNTEIIEVSSNGTRKTVVTTGSTPQRGTFSISAGNRYYGSKAIHIIEPGDQQRISPISYGSTGFGHYVLDRSAAGIPTATGVSSFYAYALESDAIVTLFKASSNGISGIGSTSVNILSGTSGILTTSTYNNWVYLTSTSPVIITTVYYDPANPTISADKGLLSPAVAIDTATYGSSYVKYTNDAAAITTRTLYNTTVAGVGTLCAYGSSSIILVQTADGSGSDMKQGIPIEYLSNTYSFGETLSDYSIIAPYPNTVVDVSYWNGSSWVLGERHNLNPSIITDPQIQSRSGNTGFGVPAQPPTTTSLSGAASNLASGANLWKFEGNKSFALIINDSSDDETELLGFSSSFTERPINKQYKTSEIQLINDQTNSYITEYGIMEFVPSAGIGTEGLGVFSSRLSGSNTQLVFTPSQNSSFEIRGFQINVGRF